VPRPGPQIGLLAVALLCAGSIAWGADPQPVPPAVKVLTVGGASLSLSWDPKWVSSETAPGADSAEFHTPDPLQMSVQLSVGQIPAGATPEAFRSYVMDNSSREFLKQSVEKSLDVKPFGSGERRGSKVCATDRAPKPKEYKYVCQGVLTSGDAAVIFTLLYNDSGKAAAAKAGSALEALQFSKGT
jgi:hypothetical protein